MSAETGGQSQPPTDMARSTAEAAAAILPGSVPRSLASLPDSLLLLILPMMDVQSLLRSACTCRELRRMSSDASLFERSSIRSLQRFMLRPPSLRHMRALYSTPVGRPCPIPALDLTRMQTPPGASELLPPAAFSAVRLCRLRDQTLCYDLHGCEYLCREVFGPAGALLRVEPRAGNVAAMQQQPMEERGLRHLIVCNPATDALERDSSIGFAQLASDLSFPPLPCSLPELRTCSSSFFDVASAASSSRRIGRGYGGGNSAAGGGGALHFEYSDVHLGLICFHLAASLRTLLLPFANCGFTSMGLTKLKFLPALRTLAIGVRDLAGELHALPGAPEDGSGLRSLALGLRALRSEEAAIRGARRVPHAATSLAQAEQHRRDVSVVQRARRAQLEATSSFFRAPPLEDPVVAEQRRAAESQRAADSQDPFVQFSLKYAGLRSLALHWTFLCSEQGLEDLTAAQVMHMAVRMRRLTALKLAKQTAEDGRDRSAFRRGGVVQAMDRLLHVAATLASNAITNAVTSQRIDFDPSISPSPSPPPPLPHLRHLMHSACLAPLAHFHRLSKLALEGWALFEGTLDAWAASSLSSSLRSLTLVRCDLVTGSCAQIAVLKQLEYLELSRCRIGAEGLEALLATWESAASLSPNPLQELILNQCVNARGECALINAPWLWEDEIDGTPIPLPPSPLRHLQHLPRLSALFLAHAESSLSDASERHVLLLQRLMASHMESLAPLLASPSCHLRSLTWAHGTFATEHAWCQFLSAVLTPRVASSLISLDLSYSVGLTDAVLDLLSRAFPRLVRLDLSYARPEQGGDERDTGAQETSTADTQPVSVEIAPFAAMSNAPASASVSGESVVDSDECPPVDPPMCAYTPASLLHLLVRLRALRSLRVLCCSAADASLLMRPSWLRRCADVNAECHIVASRWQ